MNLRSALEEGARGLSGVSAPQLEAEVLLAHTLSTPRSFLYANPELELPDGRLSHYRSLVRRRARGEPVAYIIGQREFWSLTLRVTPAVLIPRFETELLVECALQALDVGSPARVADLGTGSGAVALAIASEHNQCEVHATDIDPEALALAQLNARELGLERIRFHAGSWFEPLDGQFSVVVSNPPYVGASDPHLQRGDCRFEPPGALAAGEDGLEQIRIIIRHAPRWLEPGGWLMLEHGHEQGRPVRELFSRHGFASVTTKQDLSARDRVTLGRKLTRLPADTDD